jgi:hypothetical protein
MRLNELTGIKNRGYDKLTLPELITQVMKDNGFVKLGTGAFGVAYRRGNDPYVYKLFVQDTGYSKFLEYAQKHSSHNLPKIYGVQSLTAFWKRPEINIDERLYIAKVEYIPGLNKGSKFAKLFDELPEYEGLDFVEGSTLPLDRIYEIIHSKASDIVEDLALKMNKFEINDVSNALFSAAGVLLYAGAGFEVDAHSGNFGLRADDSIVCIDPLVKRSMTEPNFRFHPTDRDDGDTDEIK